MSKRYDKMMDGLFDAGKYPYLVFALAAIVLFIIQLLTIYIGWDVFHTAFDLPGMSLLESMGAALLISVVRNMFTE